MKRILSVFLVLVFSVSITLTALNTSMFAEETYVPTGVVIGDSISEGCPVAHGRLHVKVGEVPVTLQPIFGVDLSYTGDKASIAYNLSQTLGIPVINNGVDSQTTGAVWLRWNRDVLAQTATGTEAPIYNGKTLDKIPDFVVIICGINDIVRTPDITVEVTEGNLGNMIDSAIANGIKPIVFNLGIRIDKMTDESRTKLKQINAWLLTKKASTPGMALIDFRSFSALGDNLPNTTYIVDGLHPNKLGYIELAKKIIAEADPLPVTGVTLSKATMNLKVAQTLNLLATISPLYASNKTVTWKSSNTKVATVSATGNVKGTGRGYAAITATTASGSKIATCKVTVTQPVKSVTLSRKTLTLKKGSTYRLLANVLPSNANNKKVTWKSSRKTVATVSYKGLVKGIKKGTSYIYVYTVDGKKSARCTVTVK